MKTYRVYSSHCGDAPTSELWHCKNDKEALEKFRKDCARPDNAWDDLRIERIDVVEKVTSLAHGHGKDINVYEKNVKDV